MVAIRESYQNEKMGLCSLGRAVGYVFFLFLPVLCSVDNPSLNDVLEALERAVNYYLENHKHINLDGIYGLRVVEGQILQILSRHSAGRYPHLSPSFVARLEKLKHQAHNISESALPFLRFQDSIYYNRLKPLVEHPTTVFQSYRRLDHSLRWYGDFKKANTGLLQFDEELSDRCMSELMGTTLSITDDDKAMEHEGREKPKCRPTVDCLKVMFSRGREEYELTHQLLYTLLAEQMQCTTVLDQWLRENEEPLGVKQMQLEFCTNNFAEIQEKVNLVKGNIFPIYQDLFMEQQFVCPVLGFMEFLHVDWLKQILSWQQTDGCFGQMGRQLPLDFLAKKHIDYSYEEDGMNQKGQGGEAQRTNLAQHSRHIRDQFGVQELNSVVKQANDSILELHHAPAEDPQANQRFNLVMGPPVGQQDNNYLVRTAAPFLDEPLGHKPPNRDNDKFAVGDFDVRENWDDDDRFGAGGPILNADGQANVGQAQDDKIPLDDRIDPFGGNVQGFQRDQFLQGDLALPDQIDKNEMQHREGFRRLLSDENWTGRKLLVEKRLAGGCLSHKTAVAVGALSQYLRYMIDPGTSIYKDDIKLNGVNLLMQPINRLGHQDSQDQDVHNMKAKNLLETNEDDENEYKDDLGENQEEDDDYGNDKDEDLGDGPDLDADRRDEYGDADGDEDDEEGEDEKDGINPKMQPVIHAANAVKAEKRQHRQPNGDKEYEQYIDEEEEQQNLALNVDAPNHRHNAGFQKDNLFDVLNKQHQEEESYSYYDNQEDHPEGHGVKSQKIIAAIDISQATEPVTHVQTNPMVSPTKLYMFVTAFTVVVLYFMFKFVRRRRVVIRYYHH